MMQRLTQLKASLRANIEAVEAWNSLYIDYENPTVERLWKQEGEYRICLHKIHPCENSTFFHPHPWPSAVQLISGSYLMGIGQAESIRIIPPVEKIVYLKAGDSYEMLTELDYHYVQPVGEYSYSIMIMGAPFHPENGKTHFCLKALTNGRKRELLKEFKEILSSDQ